MEPVVRSQKKYSLQIINQASCRKAIAAMLSVASVHLIVDIEFLEEDLRLVPYVEGRINSRPTQLGTVEKIIVDDSGGAIRVSFVIISFSEAREDPRKYFLLKIARDGRIAPTPNSHVLVRPEGCQLDVDKLGVRDFFNT